MDIRALMTEIGRKLEENETLEKDKAQNFVKLMEVCRNNFDSLIKNELEEMKNFYQKCSQKIGISLSYETDLFCFGQDGIKIKVRTGSGSLINQFELTIDELFKFVQEDLAMKDDFLSCLYRRFGNVQDTLHSLRLIKEGYADIFKRYVDRLADLNNTLFWSNKDIKECLDNSDTVGQKELLIGGKTYILKDDHYILKDNQN